MYQDSRKLSIPLIAACSGFGFVAIIVSAMLIAPRKQTSTLPPSGTKADKRPAPMAQSSPSQVTVADEDATDRKEMPEKTGLPKLHFDALRLHEVPSRDSGLPLSGQTAKKSAQRPERAETSKEKKDREIQSSRPLTEEEQLVEGVRGFIVENLPRKDGFEIVDRTKPVRTKGANKKPTQVLRVIFQANNAAGQQGSYDFLFVVQNGKVIEHAPTAYYVAAERARQAAILQLAAAADRELNEMSSPNGAFVGGYSGAVRGGWNHGSSGGGGGCLFGH
jgi:hypothetical protein